MRIDVAECLGQGLHDRRHHFVVAIHLCVSLSLAVYKRCIHSEWLKLCAGSWEQRWQKSSWKQSEGSAGEFKQTAGKWYGDETGKQLAKHVALLC
jgi:hypothetical protein